MRSTQLNLFEDGLRPIGAWGRRAQECRMVYRPGRRNIAMQEYSFTTAATGRFLSTSRVAICIALTVYCKSTKEGALAHIPPHFPVVSIKECLQEMRGRFRGVDLEVRLISARAKPQFRRDVVGAVKEDFGVDIGAGKSGSSYLCYGVTLDTLDGAVRVEREF